MVNSKTLGLILLVMSAGAALAQQAEAPKPNPLDVIPEKMPFATPYGVPISLAGLALAGLVLPGLPAGLLSAGLVLLGLGHNA